MVDCSFTSRSFGNFHHAKCGAHFHAKRLLVRLHFLSRHRGLARTLCARVAIAKARSFAATICSGSSALPWPCSPRQRTGVRPEDSRLRAPIGPRVASRASECQSKRHGRLVDQSTSATLRSAEVLAADRKAEKGIYISQKR